MWHVHPPVLTYSFSTRGSPQLPSEYEANPELLFYRITHLNHRQQYLIWAAAVTTAGRGNFSDKVTVEPAAKGESLSMKGIFMTRDIQYRGWTPGKTWFWKFASKKKESWLNHG